MSACADEDRIASFFAGALRDTEVDELEAHVADCDACRELIDACASDDDAASPIARDPADDPRTFHAEQLVAGRYRVVRFLAAGGMGEVYEVEDLELGERVALKTMRVELTDAPHALERFRREAQLARKITHPNVCRVFDVAKHQEPSGDLVVFMTMALLAGESLSARVRRDGPLAVAEALPLVRDLAAALDAAHAAGVLHRDFKSDNVQLVPGEHGPRAVVTDFGLARPTERDREAVTRTGGFVGTPAYMAPEQVENRELTPATDVYAFGIVLFEMMTGELPFIDDSPLAVAARRLRQEPRSIRALRPELPVAWGAVVRRCLEVDPVRRFGSAGLAVAALGKRSKRGLVIGLGVALGAGALVAAGVGAMMLARMGSPHERVSVALAPAIGEPWLGALVDDGLTNGLADHHALVASGEDVRFTAARWRLEPRVQLADGRVTLAIAALRDDAPAGQAEVTGSLAELPELVERALGELPLHLDAASGRLTRFPARAETLERYGTALARTRAYDVRAARDALVTAVALEPAFPWARLALARANSALGYDARAKTEATAAVAALPIDVDEVTLLRFRAEAAGASREWDAAIAARQRLVALDPEDPARLVKLAHDAAEGRRRDPLDAALAQLRVVRPGDPQIDFYLAQLFENDSPTRVEAGTRAVAAAERAGAPELAARARLLLGVSLGDQLQLDAALATEQQAAEAFTAVGNRTNHARALRYEASFLALRGKLDDAWALEDAARAEYIKADNPADVVDVLGELSAFARARGDLGEARSLYQQGVALAVASGSHRASSAYMMNLGAILVDEGNLADGRAQFDKALPLRRTSGWRRNLVATLASLAEADAEAAQPARPRLDEARSITASMRAPIVELELARFEASIALAGGDLDGSLAASRPALAMAQHAGVDGTAFAALVVTALARGSSTDTPRELALVTTSAAPEAIAARTEWQVRRARDTHGLAELRQAALDAEHAGEIRRALELELLLGQLDQLSAPLRGAARSGRAGPFDHGNLAALAERARALGFVRIATAASSRR